jgi:hypothetical protein
MTATFADYAAQQDARNTIQLNVTKWTLMLCDALKQNYIDYSIKSHKRCLERGESVDYNNYSIKYHKRCLERGESVDYNNSRITDLKNGECDYEFIIESGRKYHKIIMVIDNGPDRSPSRSVHAFVNKKTGEIYKSSSWKSPAKGVRYDLRIIEQREWLLQNADWASAYLYAK